MRRERIRRVFGGARRAAPAGRRGRGGTGFFIAADGALVTNAHVVAGCRTVMVDAAGGASGTARPLGLDAENDLALMGRHLLGVPPEMGRSDDVGKSEQGVVGSGRLDGEGVQRRASERTTQQRLEEGVLVQ